MVVLLSALCADLSADFATREPRCVHVGVSVATPQRLQEGRKVVRIQALITGAGIQRDDICGRRRAAYGAGGRLWAVRLLRIGCAALWPTAEEGHHVGIDALLAEVNVREERRPRQPFPGEGPTESRAVRAQPGAECSTCACTFWRNLVERREVRRKEGSPVLVIIGPG